MKLKPFVPRRARDISLPAGRHGLKKGNLYGFTLIEVMVVLAITGVIMASVMAILSGSFRANNRSKWLGKIDENGNFVLGEIRRNILDANRILPCGIGSSVSFNNMDDGNLTTIVCDDGKIASVSADTIDLTTSDVTVSDCSTFVTCDTLPSSTVSNVNFSFTLGAGITGGEVQDYVTKKFESKVSVRN